MGRYRRIVASLAVLIVAVGLAATSSVAQAATQSLAPTTWGYIDSGAPRTPFVNGTGDAPIGTFLESGNTAHTYRSFFTFDLTAVRGLVVHMANFFTVESTVTNCAADAPLELWQSRPLKATSTWNNPPGEVALLQRYDRGGDRICPAYLGADLLAVVNAALARRDPSLTVELRVAAAQERDPALGRRLSRPGLGLSTNSAPTVGELGLSNPDRPCGTRNRHPSGNDFTEFKAAVADTDPLSLPSARFAIWPVNDPDQRIEFDGNRYGGLGTSIGSTDLSRYPDGAELAWAARATDGLDTSDWSRPCYLTIDRTAPAKAPAVGSRLYREGNVPTGGSGVKGTFHFDAEGDRDVVTFEYRDDTGRWWYAPARRPGGSASIEYTPTRSGPQSLYVTSIDAAGNRGPTTQYEFWVRYTAPWGQVDVAGVGLPSRITLSSSVAQVTEFSYQLPGGAEVRFPATDGTGSTEITFTASGYYDLTVRTYAGSRMVGAGTMSVQVSDAPDVNSAEFTLDRDAVVGDTGQFTFRPRTTGVVSYVYTFDWDEQTIAANPDGSAVLPWTADAPGWYQLTVQSVRADGSRSEPAYYQFSVIDNHPQIYVFDLVNWPRRDGPGRPLDVQLTSGLPNLAGFAYVFNGGAEQTVMTGGNPYAVLALIPDHAGANTLMAVGLLADGGRTPATTLTFDVWNGPLVSWSPDQDGVVGRPVTFTFRPALPGVALYRYSLDWAEEQTVAAGADGSASVTWTPQSWGNATIRVTSIGTDGTASQERTVYFSVRDNRVSVYSSYTEYFARGGIGSLANFQFFSQLFGEIVEYRYHLNDEPEQTIVPTAGTSTYVQLPLSRNGVNTLFVQSRTAGGELSPVTEYRFLVGTAPHVVSAEYPENTWAGGGGIPGTFEFSGGTAGILSFEYSFDGAPASTVVTDPEGRATAEYTPPNNYEQHTLVVTGHLLDGTPTDTTIYYFLVGGGQ